MKEHEERAVALFHDGYNCAQAVLLAFCDELGLNRDAAARVASSFGGGVGRLREICGAVSGGCMALGLRYGGYDSADPQAKADHYRRVQEFVNAFREENHAILCRELLGLQEGAPTPPRPESRTPEFYKKRPCAELVACAARLIEARLEQDAISEKD